MNTATNNPDDLIEWARREWCDCPPCKGKCYNYGSPVCPPEVVAALFDLRDASASGDLCNFCSGSDVTHEFGCPVRVVDEAIAAAREKAK